MTSEAMETAQHDYLEGHLLIAMPGMGDPRFERSVIYMCAHSQDGAMGIVINQVSADISFSQLLTQLGVDQELPNSPPIDCPVHRGGPVETGRGFVLHSNDYQAENSTLNMNEGISLTATLDVVRAIASGQGPDKRLLALGYSGWGPGQLESEIQANGWLSCRATANLVFNEDIDGKYQQSLAAMGVDLTMLSSEAGRA